MSENSLAKMDHPGFTDIRFEIPELAFGPGSAGKTEFHCSGEKSPALVLEQLCVQSWLGCHGSRGKTSAVDTPLSEKDALAPQAGKRSIQWPPQEWIWLRTLGGDGGAAGSPGAPQAAQLIPALHGL